MPKPVSAKKFDELLATVSGQVGQLMASLQSKKITIDEWHPAMQKLLATSNIAALFAGQGSRAFTEASKKYTTDFLKAQFTFLQNFAVEVQTTEEYKAGWTPRAEMYAKAIRAPYEAGRTKMLPLPAMPADGTTQCRTNCKCTWRIEWINEEQGDADCYWVRHADDSCQTCVERARRWNPLRIRGAFTGPLPNPDTVLPADEKPKRKRKPRQAAASALPPDRVVTDRMDPKERRRRLSNAIREIREEVTTRPRLQRGDNLEIHEAAQRFLDRIRVNPNWTPLSLPKKFSVTQNNSRFRTKTLPALDKLFSQRTVKKAPRYTIEKGKVREYYRGYNNSLFIHEGTTPRTLAHELGHWLEKQDPEYFKKIVALKERFTKGESSRQMSKVTGISAYGQDEVTYVDRFFHPYVGKLYGEEIRQKPFATELTSMYIDTFLHNPAELEKGDGWTHLWEILDALEVELDD